MAKLSDIIKSIIDKETISKNKWLIMLIITALSGGTGTVMQTFNVSAKESEKIKAVREVAEGFQSVMAEMKPKQKVINKTIQKVYKTDCGICTTLMNDHRKEFH